VDTGVATFVKHDVTQEVKNLVPMTQDVTFKIGYSLLVQSLQKATKLNFNPLRLRGTSENGLQKGLFCIIMFVPFLSYMRQHELMWEHSRFVNLIDQPKCTLSKHLFHFFDTLFHDVMQKRWRFLQKRAQCTTHNHAIIIFCSGAASRDEGPARAEIYTYRNRTYIKPCDSIFVVMTLFMDVRCRNMLHVVCSKCPWMLEKNGGLPM